MFDLEKINDLAGGLTKTELHNESLFSLGALYVYQGIKINVPTAGHFVLLEILNNSYITGDEITDTDIDTAFFILAMGKACIGVVFEYSTLEKDIKTRVTDFIKTIPNYNRIIIKVFLKNYFSTSTNGFDLLPKSESETDKKMVFDAEWLTAYISVCRKITGYDMDKIIWNLPLIQGGFCMAEYAKEQGVKNIERQQDWKAMIDEIKQQAEQEKVNKNV